MSSANGQGRSMTKPVSAVRQRMIDDMTIRNMSPNTEKAYIRAVQNFSRHFGKSREDADAGCRLTSFLQIIGLRTNTR